MDRLVAANANANSVDQYYMNGISEELTVIPEPSMVFLIGLGSLSLLRRRRKYKGLAVRTS